MTNKEDKEIWNKCFDEVIEGLKSHPIHYRDSENLKGEVFLKELYDKNSIDFEDGVNQLVDLVAFLVDTNGYKIVKK